LSTAHTGEQNHGGLAGRLNWLRAGVLGANDGIVSTAGLVVGVACPIVAVSWIRSASESGPSRTPGSIGNRSQSGWAASPQQYLGQPVEPSPQDRGQRRRVRGRHHTVARTGGLDHTIGPLRVIARPQTIERVQRGPVPTFGVVDGVGPDGRVGRTEPTGHGGQVRASETLIWMIDAAHGRLGHLYFPQSYHRR
jgi:hypothetical protein